MQLHKPNYSSISTNARQERNRKKKNISPIHKIREKKEQALVSECLFSIS